MTGRIVFPPNNYYSTTSGFSVDDSWTISLLVAVTKRKSTEVNVYTEISDERLISMTINEKRDPLYLDNPPDTVTLRYNDLGGYFSHRKSLFGEVNGRSYLSIAYQYTKTGQQTQVKARGVYIITDIYTEGSEYVVEGQDVRILLQKDIKSISWSYQIVVNGVIAQLEDVVRVTATSTYSSVTIPAHTLETDLLSYLAYTVSHCGAVLRHENGRLTIMSDSDIESITVSASQLFDYPKEVPFDGYNVFEVTTGNTSISEDIRVYSFDAINKVSVEAKLDTSKAQDILDRMVAKAGKKVYEVEIATPVPIFSGQKCTIPTDYAIDGGSNLPQSHTGIITEVEETYDGGLTAVITITQNLSEIEPAPCTWEEATTMKWDDATAYTWNTIESI